MKRSFKLNNGTTAYFNSYNLKAAIRGKKEKLERAGEKFSIQAIQEEIAEETGISFSAIKHWCAGHNTPSDMEKIQDLASALGVDVEYLLDIEEDNKDMNNTNISNIDYSSVKGTIRSVYTSMVNYIEAFRLGTIVGLDGINLKMMFMMLYGELMRTRLDIPESVFRKLDSFAVNYLQQFGCYLNYSEFAWANEFVTLPDNPDDYLRQYNEAFEFEQACPWSEYLVMDVYTESEDFKLFSRAAGNQFIWDMDEMSGVGLNEFIIKGAYNRLAEILQDHMIE